MTYVWMLEGWLYLAVLLDLHSRRVFGWAMGQRLTVELAEQALTMALAIELPRRGSCTTRTAQSVCRHE